MLAAGGGSALAQPAASSSVPSPSDSGAASPETIVERPVQDALENNPSLKQELISLEQRRAALAQTQGQYLPSLDLTARYTRSRGGRTIEFPVGDAVNPAYRALDQMNPNRQFPRLQNRDISLLRETEQRTELQLRQPLYRPEIWRGAQARSHEVESQEASVEAQRRRLVRDVKTAYYRYRKAQARVEILEATQTLVRETRRTNQQLLEAAKATKDAVYRAEAEVLSVRQKLTQARASVRQARRRLNVLRDRPSDAEIPTSQTDTETLIERRVRTIEQRLGRPLFGAEALADASGGSGPVRTAVDAGTADGNLESPQNLVDDRPTLERLDAAAEAADAQRRAAQTDFLPTVSLAVDAGLQGKTYGFSGDKPFASASVVLKWNLFDGLTDHRRVQRRRLETKRLRTRRKHVERQLTQKVRTALEAVRVAHRSLQTAQARVRAAQESFRLTRRRHEVGRANQATLIDARTALTEAKMNLNVTRYDLLIHLAELEHAAGLAPTGSK
jgi:outer membrane protein TolC